MIMNMNNIIIFKGQKILPKIWTGKGVPLSLMEKYTTYSCFFTAPKAPIHKTK